MLWRLGQGAQSGAGLDNLGPQTRMLPALAPGLPMASREAGSQPHPLWTGAPSPTCSEGLLRKIGECLKQALSVLPEMVDGKGWPGLLESDIPATLKQRGR